MYKTHLAAWCMFKNNRENDVAAMVHFKQARDAAGKSSVILRSGKIVDIHRIHNYLKRKKLNPQDLIQSTPNEERIHDASHIYICTPPQSPLSH